MLDLSGSFLILFFKLPYMDLFRQDGDTPYFCEWNSRVRYFTLLLHILKAFQPVQIPWRAEGAEQTSQFVGLIPSHIFCTDTGAPHRYYSTLKWRCCSGISGMETELQRILTAIGCYLHCLNCMHNHGILFFNNIFENYSFVF